MTSTTTDIQLYESLRQKLGNAEAEALVSFVDSKLKKADEQNLKLLATKDDLKSLEVKLTKEIHSIKTEAAIWMFGIFVALMSTMIALYFKK